MAPLRHEFGWGADDWDKLAAASSPATSSSAARSARAATASTTGATIPDLANVGYPDRRGARRRHLRRHQAPGHRRPRLGAVGDRAARLRDGRSARVHHARRRRRLHDASSSRQDGREPRARVRHQGRPATDKLKVSIAYRAGFKAVGTLVYAWPDALDKAQARRPRAARAPRPTSGFAFDQILTEFVGVIGDARSARRRSRGDAPEVQLRVGVRGDDRSGGRALHARDRAARAQRPAERHRLRRRPAEGRGDRRLLAGARSTRRVVHDRRWRCSA